jgi:hypothetical protein
MDTPPAGAAPRCTEPPEGAVGDAYAATAPAVNADIMTVMTPIKDRAKRRLRMLNCPIRWQPG